MQTWSHTLGFVLASTVIAGCGLRTAISPEADVDEGQPAAMNGGSKQPCGFGQPCNVKDLGGRTCESLSLGAGDLSCDPNTCLLVLKGCGPSPVMNAGTGGQGDTTGIFGGIGTPGGLAPGVFGGDAGVPPNFGGTGTTDEDAGTMPFPGGFFGGLFGFFGGANDGSGGSGNNGSRGSGN
jgi:hypothetical protein